MSPKTVLAPFYCVARHHGTIKRFLQFSIQPYGRTDCSLTELFTALSSYSRAPKLGEEESFTSAYQESTWSSARCESRGLQAGGYLRHLKKQASLVLLLQADVIVAGRLKRSKWQAVLSWKEILDEKRTDNLHCLKEDPYPLVGERTKLSWIYPLCVVAVVGRPTDPLWQGDPELRAMLPASPAVQ